MLAVTLAICNSLVQKYRFTIAENDLYPSLLIAHERYSQANPIRGHVAQLYVYVCVCVQKDTCDCVCSMMMHDGCSCAIATHLNCKNPHEPRCPLCAQTDPTWVRNADKDL